jgi:hypothetical protein
VEPLVFGWWPKNSGYTWNSGKKAYQSPRNVTLTIKRVGTAIHDFILEVRSLIIMPWPWRAGVDTHLDFIMGSPRAGYCVVRKVMSQQERVSDLCKLQAEPGMQPDV